MALVSPWRLRESRRQAAKQRDKYHIEELTSRIWFLERQLSDWWDWYEGWQRWEDDTHACDMLLADFSNLGQPDKEFNPKEQLHQVEPEREQQRQQQEDDPVLQGWYGSLLTTIEQVDLEELSNLLRGREDDEAGRIASAVVHDVAEGTTVEANTCNTNESFDESDVFFTSFFDYFVTSEAPLPDTEAKRAILSA